jgi:hypothetical protein
MLFFYLADSFFLSITMSWSEKKSAAEVFFRQNDFEKAMKGYAAAAEAAIDQAAGRIQDQADECKVSSRPPCALLGATLTYLIRRWPPKGRPPTKFTMN